MGLSGILYTGQQALLAHQQALQVVGQNIANVNTPGYSRERPVLSATQPSNVPRELRTGVEVTQVTRVYDRFITGQLDAASAQFQSSQEESDLLGQIEALFTDLDQENAGVGGALSKLFQGFQDLAGQPQSIPHRVAVIRQGETVASAVNGLYQQLQGRRQEFNAGLNDQLSEANEAIRHIAELSGKIRVAEGDPHVSAHTLFDERDRLVKQLAETIGTTSFTAPDGTFNVLLGGRPVVEGVRASSFVTRADAQDPVQQLVYAQDEKGNLTHVTASIRGGSVHGLLQARDRVVPDLTHRLDRLAAQLTSSMNQLHSQGFGLDGTTGTPFFVPRQATGEAAAANTGGGTLQSVTMADPSQLTLDDYSITFVSDGPPPTFDVRNVTTGDAVATGQSYSAGTPITFAGLTVSITDGGTLPRNGDSFHISTTRDAARQLAVDTTLRHDPRQLAAAQTPSVGNNANALALADLQHATVLDGDTFGGFYGGLVTSVGLVSQQSTQNAAQQKLLVTTIENRRESLAGVSLDEEQIDLIRFQQAYNAAANYIRVADTLTQTVLGLIR